ncbi:Tyrosine-protein phosphatase pmp1 [Cladobotryum mycophilum]|uniref:protein-tyrosine-phosphatase n=1 Tax=Cladobotryum mycophilum TaxID=491253 RepID=A0ABR0SDH2_9HYPO
MPSAASRRIYEDQIPSFMSVFDLDAETMADRETVTVVNPKLVDMVPKVPVASQQPDMSSRCLSSEQPHNHRNSTSTQTSESADSSPTTTFSTTNSSPLSDPSPSSSPDSPLNLIPLNNYPSTTFGPQPNGLSLPRRLDTSLTTLERPMTSPAPRKPRNMKGLSIQPPAVANAMSKSMVMEPGSPSFIKPAIPAMKRKPSLLSIKTNTTDLITKTSLEVPASPALPPILQRRALKHSASSPHMLTSIKTATFGPSGGMTFPKMLERNESGLSEVLRPMKTSMHATFAEAIAEEESPIKTQLASRGDFPVVENNEDQKSPGYPEGPIAIYGDDVFLYSEPTATEASRFDVVINVAREVKNPFNSGRGPTLLSPIPDTAVSNASFTTAWEYQPSDDRSMETPTTPRASNPFKTPEYIHIPWDHNTDISPDLMNLCEMIENRTKEGKKVLVHCQQGASRSASLIIAYGLYQRPELSVNDAYYAAQAKSRWISPNMKLMYSLQDFQKNLSKKRSPQVSNVSRPRVGRSPSKHKLTLSSDVIELDSKEPQTAPLPAEKSGAKEREDVDSLPKRLASNLDDGLQSISPGPASAPLSFSWRENLEKKRKEQEEHRQEKWGMVEPEQSKLESSYQEPQHLQPPSMFKLHAPPQRPKSAQGILPKPALAPIMLPDTRSVSLAESGPHHGFGFRNPLTAFSGQAPSQLFMERSPIENASPLGSAYPDGDALMSPRVETMVGSPMQGLSEIPGMRFMAPSPEPAGGLFSPRENMFSRNMFFPFGQPAQIADPRSPPTKGEAPIIRSIDDIL